MKNLFSLNQSKNLKNVFGALLMLCFAFTSQTFAQRTLQETKVAFGNEKVMQKKPKVTITLDIGRKSKDCKKFGVCSISVGVGLSVQNDGDKSNSVVATINPNYGRRLVIIVPKKGISKDTYMRYFSNDVFVVEEDFSTDKAFYGESGLQFKIPRGVYDIVDQGDSFMIIF